ncbi:MAG: hypothetical protein WHT08_05550 [Bryobacteraceae bacterium]|jgi:hypothetical protein
MPRAKQQRAAVSKAEADRRKAVALAELRELEVRQRRGELLEASAVEQRWAAGLASLRDRLLALPDRVAATVAGRSEVEARRLLRDALEEALRGIHADG